MQSRLGAKIKAISSDIHQLHATPLRHLKNTHDIFDTVAKIRHFKHE